MKIITKTSFIIILCVTFIFQGYGLSEEKKLIAVYRRLLDDYTQTQRR